jgi:hypothetical protein
VLGDVLRPLRLVQAHAGQPLVAPQVAQQLDGVLAQRVAHGAHGDAPAHHDDHALSGRLHGAAVAAWRRLGDRAGFRRALISAGDGLATVRQINATSVRQALAPPHALGRVSARVHLFALGVAPFGALTESLLSECIGDRPTVWVAAIGSILGLLWLLASPLRTLRGLPSSEAVPGRAAGGRPAAAGGRRLWCVRPPPIRHNGRRQGRSVNGPPPAAAPQRSA